jgi:hypothetical protein
MAASDPTPGVATPTGVLQGVAAFSWDGTNWQPTAGAGPDVATSTGVLLGVAPFSWDGVAWQPSGRARPGVPTPTGVLDGVAVYNWSGSAWTPAGGQPTPSTPTGALRGVAAFNWDGAAWQPAGQAGPTVATPYGVLAGVAVFNWTGSAWAAVQGATLDLNFLNGPPLDPRLTFTRGSTATYFDATGTMQTATTNTPRFDYDPVTHALRGLLIEEARTNLALNSADISNASWAKGSAVVAVPIATANQTTSPDGGLNAASVVFPAVSGGGAVSIVTFGLTPTAAVYTWSIYLKGSIGGEQLYLYAQTSITTWYRLRVTLTTTWQRYTLITGTLTAAAWVFGLGCDLRDGGQAATPAQTIYAWGGQIELGAFATSYIPTTAAAVTRAVDAPTMPTGAWFNGAAGTIAVEAYAPPVGGSAVLNAAWAALDDGTINNVMEFRSQATFADFRLLSFVAGANSGVSVSTNTMVANTIFKGAGTYNISPASSLISLNGVAPGGSTVGALPSVAMTTLRIGPTRGVPPDNAIRRVRYWPRVLSNSELQSVTT